MKKISEHISYSESIRSDTAKRYGINNYFTLGQLSKMVLVAEKVFEPVREHFNVPIYITSFFRTTKVNRLMNGAKSSQHTTGEAMDIDADVYGGVTNKEIFDYIKDNLDFDQLIGEGINPDGSFSWVHCSFKETGNRKEILTMKVVKGKKYYEEYIS